MRVVQRYPITTEPQLVTFTEGVAFLGIRIALNIVYIIAEYEDTFAPQSWDIVVYQLTNVAQPINLNSRFVGEFVRANEIFAVYAEFVS